MRSSLAMKSPDRTEIGPPGVVVGRKERKEELHPRRFFAHAGI
jgi:hypothetical protein